MNIGKRRKDQARVATHYELHFLIENSVLHPFMRVFREKSSLLLCYLVVFLTNSTIVIKSTDFQVHK